MCDFLGQSQPATHGRGEPVQPGNPDNQDYLKRRVIRRKLGIWAVVSSFIADSDVVADWLFYTTDVSSAKGALPKFGLAFAVLGTMLWFVHVTEGHVVDKALRSVTFRCCKLRGISRVVLVSNTPLGYLTYLPLRLQLTLNIVLEDLPQLIITFLVEDSITSTAGVINVTTAAMAVLAKVVDVIQKSKAEVPLAMQLRMIDIEHVVMGELLDAQDEAEEKANASAELVLALAEVSEGSLADRSRRAFALLHKSPQNVEAVQRRFEHTELEINGECIVCEVLRDSWYRTGNISLEELYTLHGKPLHAITLSRYITENLVNIHLASKSIGHFESCNGCNGAMMVEKPRH